MLLRMAKSVCLFTLPPLYRSSQTVDPSVHVCPFVCLHAHTADNNSTPAMHSNDSGAPAPKAAAAGYHNLTATAHSPRDAADTAPAGACDQADRHGDGAAAAAEKMSSSHSTKQEQQVVVRHVHMPHGDLKHLMASANARPYTGALLFLLLLPAGQADCQPACPLLC